MKEGSFVVIQSFMVNDLQLKGNELIVYATIFGFTQDGEHWFYGTKAYLAEWCGASKGTVGNCLKSLVEKGLIEMRENEERGQKFVEYRAVRNLTSTDKICTPPIQKLDGGGTKIDPINKKEEEPIREEREDIPFSEIVGYLNEKAGTHYRTGTSKTKERIRARWREGFRLDDFKRVIDVKCAEWLGTDFAKYLCPETLFGTKFEKYANQPMTRSRAKEGKGRNDAYDFDRKPDSPTVTHQHDAYDWSGYDDIRF